MNRQVPNDPKYTIVGDGKVAKHFACYFDRLGIEYRCWNRRSSIQYLKQSVNSTNIVLLLIADDAIESFVQTNPFLMNKILVHFSGSLNSQQIIGCHPLMTFSNDLYALSVYEKIPFICDTNGAFSSLFPQMNNPSFNIDQANKAHYHAMCVMAGNFTQTLMRECAKQLSQIHGLPDDIMFPYLLQNCQNFVADPNNSSTGPLARGDFATINKHIEALKNNDLAGIYKGFLKHSQTNHPENNVPRGRIANEY